MNQFEYRQVDYIREKDCTYESCMNYYSKKNNRENILLVYSESDEYLGCISISDVLACKGEIQFEYRWKCFIFKGYLKKSEDFVEEYIYYVSILADTPEKGAYRKRFYMSVYPVGVFANVQRKQRDFLKNREIHSFCIKIPKECSWEEPAIHRDCWLNPAAPAFWGEYCKKYVDSILDKIFSIDYQKAKKGILDRPEKQNIYGSGKRRIFLVGPCIVSGTMVLEGENLIDYVFECLQSRDIDYKVVRVSSGSNRAELICQLFEYDIYKNDIVLFMVRSSDAECDFDMTPIYKDYQGYKWLYTDEPIHTTYEGNRLLAETLVEKVIFPIYQNSRVEDDDVLLYSGTPQSLTNYAMEMLQEWLEGFSVNGGVCGAIVMNCNPFTLGHRYLIEQACAQVDVVYVFVVEEDASLFPFEDRMALVKACTKDLEKVRVLPSGRFMISKDTFRDYFEKAQLQEAEIDASMDIDLFGRYVAPYFHITKRFAGEEPFDRVTCQYNEQMRRRLADYGVEFIEIPRKKAGTDIISATTVRKLAGAREWEKLSSLLPGETYEYLKNNIARIEHMQSIVRQEPDDGEVYAEIVERICACDRVVIYALGSEGERILKKVPERELGKLVLCDKRAETQSLYWKGKRVISPSEFLDEYKEYDVIVTPSPRTYGCEVYMFLREHGVDKERILCNRRLAGL